MLVETMLNVNNSNQSDMDKRIVMIAFSLFLLFTVSCKKKEPVIDVVDFENLTLDDAGYWNGSDGSGGFSAGNLIFINHYNSQDQDWSGFAYTNLKDDVTPDVSNQYSSIAGSGADGSEKYAVFHYSGTPDTLFLSKPEKITDISFCNSTYTFFTIKNGNQSCKKFGGVSGNDPDWFILTLTAINSDGNPVGTVELALADFRFTDNSIDYIANAWTNIDLSDFGFIKALKFEMSSSDSGPGGMNTPGYICIDNIKGEIKD
jgi:hypothetical protein